MHVSCVPVQSVNVWRKCKRNIVAVLNEVLVRDCRQNWRFLGDHLVVVINVLSYEHALHIVIECTVLLELEDFVVAFVRCAVSL